MTASGPIFSDLDSGPFWSALRDHRLSIQRCDDCGTFRFPPRPVCRVCRSTSSTWEDVHGTGHVASWVVTHHVTHPAFVPLLPYTVLFVELEVQPGLMMWGNVRPATAKIRSGMPVEACYEEVAGGLTVLHWTPRPEL
jgi:uncharacterized OB-fold protein